MDETTILSIQKQRGTAHAVLEDGERILIPAPLFRERPLRVGERIDPDAYRSWMDARASGFALDCAVRYLAARPRTVREVQSRLKDAGYSAEISGQVVERLRREGYLNDAAFAEQWVLSREERGMGARRLSQELHRKGVDDALVQHAISGMTEEDTQRHAAEQAKKLIGRTHGKTPQDVRRKVLAALVRRGYSWAEAQRAFAQNADTEDEEHSFWEDE